MSATYTPRRAAKHWLEGAPSYVLDVLDNRKSADRYTVLFTFPLAHVANVDYSASDKPGAFSRTYIPYLGMSGAPTHPQGFSQWGEMTAHEAAMYRYREKHHRIRWADLPAEIQAHVIARATETWGAPDVVINPDGRLAILDLRRADEIAPDNSQLMLYAQIIARAKETG